MEPIICKCGAELSISSHAICLSCHEPIYTSRELKLQIIDLDKAALAIRTQATLLQVELYHRELRRNDTLVGSEPKDFWTGVKKTPRYIRVRTVKVLKDEARAALAMVE